MKAHICISIIIFSCLEMFSLADIKCASFQIAKKIGQYVAIMNGKGIFLNTNEAIHCFTQVLV